MALVAIRHLESWPTWGNNLNISRGAGGELPREKVAPRGILVSYTRSRGAQVGQEAWPTSECAIHESKSLSPFSISISL